MQITQSTSRGIINWNGFSIGAGNSVSINNGSGATLNRVTGSNLSEIMGSLNATGSVYLINKNGIVVGSTGVVTTGGSFVASTRDIDNTLFMSGGNPNFLGTNDAGIVNAGHIVSQNGDVVLVGRSVTNNGSVEASKGSAQFLAADQVLLKPASGAAGTYIVGGTGDVTNAGAVKATEAKLAAAGGNVYALAIKGASIETVGVVEKGGQIWLMAGGDTVVDGNVKATNADGTGGKITVAGTNVTVKSTAKIDVSGKKGGGTILIGGTGTRITTDETLPTSQTVTIESGAHLNADATETGAGGNIVVWSDGLTKAYGSFSAKGQTAGGFIETSGHEVDFANITIDTRATNGSFGTWLVDPPDLTIDATAAATIGTALGSSNVLIQTTATGTSGAGTVASNGSTTGRINVSSAITATGGGSLEFSAYKDILVNNAITLSGGNLTLRANNANLSAGAVYVAADLVTNGGNLTIGGGSGAITGVIVNSDGTIATPASGYTIGDTVSFSDLYANTQYGGVIVRNAILSTGAGSIVINGIASSGSVTRGSGILLYGTAKLQTTTGSISLSGDSGTGTGTYNNGICIYNGATVTTVSGAITMVGKLQRTGSTEGAGLDMVSGTISSTGTGSVGNIILIGYGTSGMSSSGLILGTSAATNAVLSTVDANVFMYGYGGASTNNYNYGVLIGSAASRSTTISTTGAGSINIYGVGGGTAGTTDNYGVYFQTAAGTESMQSTGSGNIVITGVGGPNTGSNNYGIYSDRTNSVQTSGTGSLILKGTAGGGTNSFGLGITATSAFSSTGSSNLFVYTDTLSLTATRAISSAGSLIIAPYTNLSMGVGSAASGALLLTEGLLNGLSAGTLVFGALTTGNGTASTGLLTVNTTHDFGNSNVTFVSGGSLNLAGSLTKGTGSGTANYIFQAAADIYNSNSAGIVANNGAINLTLDSDTDHSGTENITLTNATLSTGDGSLSLNDNLVLSGTVTIDVVGANNTIATIISGTGSLVKSGSGILTLSGVNTYAGATNVNEGTLKIGGSGQLGSGTYTEALTVASGASFTYNSSASQTFSALAGAGTVNLTGSGVVTISGDQALTGILNVSEYVYLTNGSNSAVSGLGNTSAINVTNGTIDLSNETSANSFIGIWGSAGIVTLNAGGVLTQSGSNTFHIQNIVLNGGTIASGTASDDGLSYGTYNFDRGINVTANSTISANEMALSEGGGTYITVSSGATLTVSGGFGNIANVADTGLILTGGGNLVLSGTNRFTSGLSANAGTLTLSGTWNLGTGTANLSAGSGATIDGNGVITAAELDLNGAGSFNLTGANQVGTLRDVGGSAAHTDTTFYNAQSLAVGSLSSSGSIVIQTTGSLTLNSGAVIHSAASGNAVALSAANAFVNNAGSGVINLTGGGRWLVYSADVANDHFGGLNSGQTALWHGTFASLAPNAITDTGNRYVFAEQPILTIRSTDDSKIYGETGSLGSDYTVSGLSAGVSGAFAADSPANILSGTPLLSSAGAATAAHVGSYGITIAAGSLGAAHGYGLQYISTGVLSVTPRSVSVSAINQTKNQGTTDPALTYSVTGLFASDSLASVFSGSLSRDPGEDKGVYAITRGSLSVSADYIISSFIQAYLTVTSAVGVDKMVPASLSNPIVQIPNVPVGLILPPNPPVVSPSKNEPVVSYADNQLARDGIFSDLSVDETHEYKGHNFILKDVIWVPGPSPNPH